jgi:type IV pilus assembly protein PilW
MSLIELLAASAIGVLLLISVGSVFITGQQAASKTAKELMLSQGMAQFLSYIREDARRAGYSLSGDSQQRLSGVSKVYLVDKVRGGNDRLAYIYSLNATESELVVFQEDAENKKLKLCSKKVSPVALSVVGECKQFESLFVPDQLQVTHFRVSEKRLGTPPRSSQVTVELTVQLTADPSKSLTKSVSFVQRS